MTTTLNGLSALVQEIKVALSFQPDSLASHPGRLLLLGLAHRVGRLLLGQPDRVVGGPHPLPLVRRLRQLHEVQRAGRGRFQELPQDATERKSLKNLSGAISPTFLDFYVG